MYIYIHILYYKHTCTCTCSSARRNSQVHTHYPYLAQVWWTQQFVVNLILVKHILCNVHRSGNVLLRNHCIPASVL